MFEKLSEEKLKKLIVGVSVAGTLLVFVLLCVMIFQFVSMGLKNSSISSYEKEIASIQQEIEKGEGDLSYYMSDEYKQIRAYGNGYEYAADRDK